MRFRLGLASRGGVQGAAGSGKRLELIAILAFVALLFLGGKSARC